MRFRIIPYLIDKFLSVIYRFFRRHFVLWCWIARNYNSYFDKVAYINACSICHWAGNNVPAYKDFLMKNNVKPQFLKFNLKQYPETSKQNYCKVYDIESRIKFGK